MKQRKCKICGCTDDNACIHPDLGACWWIDDDLCSHCAAFPNDKCVERPKDRERMEKERNRLTAYVIPGLKTMDDLVAEAFGVKVSEIQTTDRKGPGKDARFFCMWYLKETTDLSLNEIGSRYKGRDHCTVLNAVKKVNIWKETNKRYREKAEKALEMLTKINAK